MIMKKILVSVLLVGFLFVQMVPHARAATACDKVQFISDLTIPDGSPFTPGTSFVKKWRLMNIGTCNWSKDYSLVFVSGEAMGAPTSVNLRLDVVPGQMVDISVNMTAPTTTGHYRGFWKLSNASGNLFGIGPSGDDEFWVDINVMDSTAVVFDFVTLAPFAQWKSGAGPLPLPFPGASGDRRGYAARVENPHLEDDSIDSLPGLLTAPQNKYNGYIQATYPEFLVQQGDRLQTLVNCEFGATRCYVTFQINYEMPNGYIGTLWSWKERHEGRFHRADIDLSSMAGKKVKFILMVLATGYASNDRAIWGSPRIVRTDSGTPPVPPATLTPLPRLTPTATPFDSPPPISSRNCDRVKFVADVTIKDGTLFSPGAAFIKTWRLKNSGWCTWKPGYRLLFYSGDQLSAPTVINMPWVAPGRTIDLTVSMVAPTSPGNYRGNWVLSNIDGELFGVGSDADEPFWVEINVIGDSPANTGYDFVANVCSAQWITSAGLLPCPGADGDRSGFVIKLDSAKLEDGTMASGPSLLVAPEYRYNGYIQGFYPTFTVQPGDHFRTTIGCEHETRCYATFRLDYMTDTGWVGNLGTWRERNEGLTYTADVDLSRLAGRSVRFILSFYATGYAINDRGLWAAPQIIRQGGISPTATPTPAPTPATDDWLTYTNQKYGFQFKYPKSGQIGDLQENFVRIHLPFAAGTNLKEKYLDARAVENADPCQSPLSSSSRSSETTTINGIPFLKQTGGDAGAGQIHQWTAYSTVRDNVCVSMDFVLHSTNPGNYLTPPPVFDEAAESAIFTRIMATFAWLTPTPTATYTPTPTTATPTASQTPTPTPTTVTPIVSQTPTITPTSTPITTLLGPYAVILVDVNDALNIRENAGVGFPVIGYIAPFAVNVMRTGPTQQVDGSQWVEVQNPDGGTGWVNSYYLTEYVSHEEFCADTRIPSMIVQLQQALNESSGELFAPKVGPIHGVDIRLWAYQDAVNFSRAESLNIFTSTESYNWGSGPSGNPDIGTFTEVIYPKLYEVFNDQNRQAYCDDLTKVYPLLHPWPQEYRGIRYYNLYKPAPLGEEFDYRTLLIGFEYVDGQPYLFGMVSIIWEP